MRKIITVGWAGVAMAAPAHSAVTDRSEAGFAIDNNADIAADSATVCRHSGSTFQMVAS
ncbi:hypothetical protein [Sphingobium mellinum]|uniref:hypothetical protein n=1 Tax=Sphingobium mellinum TaxID=1387166 RepID=UPI0030EE932E